MKRNIFKEELIKCSVNIDKVDTNSLVILIGTLFSKDNEILTKELIEKQNKIIYCSAIEDTFLHTDNFLHVKYEVGSEVGFLALLTKQLFENNETLCDDTKEYLNELDDGYLSAESNVSEEEIEEIVKLIDKSSKCTLLFGEDIYNHPNAKELVGLLSILTNNDTLRVSLLENSSCVSEKKRDFLIEIDELQSYDGTIVYMLPNSKDDTKIFGSAQFGVAAKIKDKDIVELKIENETFVREFCLKTDAKGTIAILPIKEDLHEYRFKKVKITKMDTK